MVDMTRAAEKYARKTAAAGQDLVDGYTARSDKLARATSPEAQANYEAAMRDDRVLKRRNAKLRKLSEADLNRGMQEKGQAAYTAGTAAGTDNWQKNAAPYVTEAERIVAAMKPRTRDPAANVANRVAPLATGLRAMKDKQA